MKEKSAGAVIFRKEKDTAKYLLLHYRSINPRRKKGGHWDFPKGIIEKGESESETVKREIKEETGIKDIKIIDAFKGKIKYFFNRPKFRKTKLGQVKRGNIRIFKTVVFYLAETKTKQVKLSDEHIGYKWLSYKKAIEKLTYQNAKDILKKANDHFVSR